MQFNQPGAGSPGQPSFSSTVGAALGNGGAVMFATDTSGNVTGLAGPGGKIVLVIGGPVTVSVGFTVTAADEGKVFTCTTALTITIPASLSPRPSFIVNPPASGNTSIAVSGGAQVNGATTTLTRSRANNSAGFVVTAYAESDGYGVSGS